MPSFAQIVNFGPIDGDFIYQDGESLPNSFTGGFNAPRPQFWDINNDGILDILLQRDQKSILFFQGIQIVDDIPQFAYEANKFEGLDPGFWFRLSDINNDGQLSLFIARELAKIEHYYWNPASEHFDLITEKLFQSNSQALSFDPGSIPEFADINCDGDKDLFLPISDGTLVYYENIGKDGNGSPIFELAESRFQDILINVTGRSDRNNGHLVLGESSSPDFSSLNPSNESRHGAGSVSFVDYDLDGDLDLVWGDFFSSGLYLFMNEGNCQIPDIEVPIETSDYVRIPVDEPIGTSGFNLSDWVDLSGDGQLDLVVSIQGGAFALGNDKEENLLYFEKVNQDEFDLKTTKLIDGFDVGQDSFPELVDIDGDGFTDLFVGNSFNLIDGTPEGRLAYLTGIDCPDCVLELNIETRDFMSDFVADFDMGNVLRIKPSFVDIDNDEDQDLFIGRNNGTLIFFENEGSAENFSFSDGIRNYAGIDVRSESSPEFFDYDGDGDFDLFIGSSSGSVYHYNNTGDSSTPSFTLQSDSFLSLDLGRRSIPVFGDADGDGVKDLLLLGESQNLLYKGSRDSHGQYSFTILLEDFLDLPSFSTATMGPLRRDSQDDLITGSVEGGLLYFRNETVRTSNEDHEMRSAFEIELFPNPVGDQFSIRLDRVGNQRLYIELINPLGRVVMETPVQNRTTLSVVDLRAGLYLVRLRSSKETLAFKTLIILD